MPVLTTARAAAAAFATALTASVLVAPAAQALDPAWPAKPFDLNGDGRDEVVVGMPSWDAGGAAVNDGRRVTDSGAVLVLWGGRDRVDETFVTQDSPGLPGDPADTDRFGSALASADFDRDGFADLAVGAQFDSESYGSLTVLYGSRQGLSDRVTRIPSGGHGAFGSALAAADFDGDGYVDLAVGAPADDPERAADGSGSVVLLTGGPEGFSLDRSTTIPRPTHDMPRFGSVLGVGDFDGDGHEDLVEGYGGTARFLDGGALPGHVTVAAGSEVGPTTARLLSHERASAFATADLDQDGSQELVVGQEYRAAVAKGRPLPRGRISIYRGSATGLVERPTVVTQATPGVPGSDEHGDRFGAAVDVADIDMDGRFDVLVGAPGEDGARGRVTVLHGSGRGTGIDRRNHVTLDQASPGVPGARERGDLFGASLSVVDVSGDSRRDITIGAPGENHGRGAVIVVRLKGIFYVPKGVRSFSLASLHRAGDGARPGFGTVLGG